MKKVRHIFTILTVLLVLLFPHSSSLADETSNQEDNESETTSSSESKSAQAWYDEAMSHYTAGARVETFLEALNEHPNHKLLVDGLNDSVKNLLNWVSRIHKDGEYSKAVDHYQYIIELENIRDNLLEEANFKLEYASNGNAYPTANQMYKEAMMKTTASGRLDAFIEAYNYYSNNSKIENGLHDSAHNLFDWAEKKHKNHEFETAKVRYSRILGSPSLENELKSTTEQYLEDAKAERRPAEIILNEARNEWTASGKVELYQEGVSHYPNNSALVKGLNESSLSLLNWARKQHNTGEYDIAIDRYNKILNTKKTSEKLIDSINLHLDRAENNLNIPQYEQLIEEYNENRTVSGKFEVAKDITVLYPGISDVELMNEAASNLIDWALKQHNESDFKTAKARYEKVLDFKYVDQSLIDKAEQLYADANKGKRSANAILEQANNAYQASTKLELYLEGHEFYPNNSRFIEGVNSSASSLYNWAHKKQSQGETLTAYNNYEMILNIELINNSLKSDIQNSMIQLVSSLYDEAKSFHDKAQYDKAQRYYEEILAIEGIDKELKNKTEKSLEYAVESSTIPSKKDYINYANDQDTASGILQAFLDGYWLYERDQMLHSHLMKSAQNLINWATDQHNKSNFNTASKRYKKILNLPDLDTQLKEKTEAKLSFAERSRKIDDTENLFHKIYERPTISGQFEGFSKAYVLYPNNSLIVEGLNETSKNYLDWARDNRHNTGNFENAVFRYNKIISASGISPDLVELAELLLRYAENRNVIPTDKKLIDTTYSERTISNRFGLIKDAYKIHPTSNNILEAIEDISLDYYDYAFQQHKQSNFQSAILRYQNLSSSEGVPSYVVNAAVENLELAQSKQAPDQLINITTTKYDVTFDSAVDIQMKYGNPKYDGAGAVSADRANVEYYLNPSNFKEGTSGYLQFMLLDETTSYTVNELNTNFLSGKGILQGTGEAFKKAGKDYNVNELYLIAHALHETGNGASTLASGIGVNANGEVVRDEEGNIIKDINHQDVDHIVYNMYGYGAVDNSPISGGAKYAFDEKWFSPSEAIHGGAQEIANSYLARGQNTLYKMKWDPDVSGGNVDRGRRQYATHIRWAEIQANFLSDMLGNNAHDVANKFDVPQYLNQPNANGEVPPPPSQEDEIVINEYPDNVKGEVEVKGSLNFREGPSTNYNAISSLSDGTEVSIHGYNKDGWYLIEVNDEEGWVSGDYVKVLNLFMVNSDNGINYRFDPAGDKAGGLANNELVVAKLDSNEDIINETKGLDGTEYNWYKIEVNGSEYWTANNWLEQIN
ncbi:SH3 domain-containing protein [Alkalibacillus almallahensis]|uniref:SH3 domain-containing protein n=1 Tax=Alkalibacillus almallahensis TaxID=1379154 RepID=UPI0014209CF1|nr:SH3 domain-containing protein [Alkalibacillus almallahensis]NIK11814.1 mannosyl-glycoprotein endo-beta-N-acetylglucosaminidase [Alkalibacillus almallahensis]